MAGDVDVEELLRVVEGNDYVYHPDSAIGYTLAKRARPCAYVAVGDVEVGDLDGIDCWIVKSDPAGRLPSGTYILRDAQGLRLISVANGIPPRDAMVVDRSSDSSDRHAIGMQWCDLFISFAQPASQASAFREGDRVLLRGSDEVFRVEECSLSDGRWSYVLSTGAVRRHVNESSIRSLVVDARSPRDWITNPPVSARRIATSITHVKLSRALTDHLYSVNSSKTIYLPHQFVPVMKFLEGGTGRLLIADEVGLGKTIEAGLIWNEMEQRGELKVALVVCPSNLVVKWQDEMRNRFDRRLRYLDADLRDQLIGAFDRGQFEDRYYLVASLEGLRRPEFLEPLVQSGVSFDLVVVDEAHNARNQGTKSSDLARALANMTDAMLFLSATPINLGNTDLFNLLNILREEEYDDQSVFSRQLGEVAELNSIVKSLTAIDVDVAALRRALQRLEDGTSGQGIAGRLGYQRALRRLEGLSRLSSEDVVYLRRQILGLSALSSAVTRTRKADVPERSALREANTVEVDWKLEERELYEAIKGWLSAKAAVERKPLPFIAQMPLRMSASCLPAAAEYLKAKLSDQFSPFVLDEERGMELDIGDEDDDSSGTLDDLFSPDADVLISATREVLSKISQLGSVDTKFEEFQVALERALSVGNGQVIVFSFFRSTIRYLYSRLSSKYSVAVLTGETEKESRPGIMDKFRRGKFQILLMSEVGSEGLDFEFCNAMFNYDLPWNPMRVEQRIGRLDRFGQQHEKIYIFNFLIPGTIDADIFDRLYKRIRVFQESIGDLEPILGDKFVRSVLEIALDSSLTVSEREASLNRLERAVVEEAENLRAIESARGVLFSTDGQMIKGIDKELRGRGNYVGASELQLYVEECLSRSGLGRLIPRKAAEGSFVVRGTPDLARMIRRYSTRGSTDWDGLDLATAISDEEDFPLAFSAERSVGTSQQLVTTRHPLAKVAKQYFDEQGLAAANYGSIQVEAPFSEGDYLVLLYLVETTGLRPSRRLVPFAVNLVTGEIDSAVGYHLLSAVASGEFTEWEGLAGVEVPSRLREVESAAQAWLRDAEEEMRRDNAALYRSRRDSIEYGFGLKMQRMLDRIHEREFSQPKNPIIHLWRGVLRNMEVERERKIAELDSLEELSMGLEPVVVAQLRVREAGSALSA